MYKKKLTVFSSYNVLKMNYCKYLLQVIVCEEFTFHVVHRVWINNLISQCADGHVWPKMAKHWQHSQTVIIY